MTKKDLTTQHLEDYQKIIKNLPFYFTGGTKIAVGKTPSNNKIKAILTNDKILNGFWLTSTFLIVMIKEKCDFERVVMMIWTICAVVQLATRGINGVLHHVDINDLLDWYLNLYKPCGSPKFQVVFDDILKKQNYYINLIMKCVTKWRESVAIKSNFSSSPFASILPPITFIPGIIYIGGPQFSEGKVLPTPIIWNGVPSEEFSTPVFLVMYLLLIYSAWNVTMCVVASDCFFSLSSILMGHRFAAIGGILKLLNYKGERDSEGDMKIIKYCYLMHLDLLEWVLWVCWFLREIDHSFFPVKWKSSVTTSACMDSFTLFRRSWAMSC